MSVSFIRVFRMITEAFFHLAEASSDEQKLRPGLA